MPEKVFNRFHRNGETQSLTKEKFHVRDPYNLPAQIEQRTATVAGIDLGGGLEIKLPLQLPGLGAQDALRDRPFQSERAADRKNLLADGQKIRVAEENPRK